MNLVKNLFSNANGKDNRARKSEERAPATTTSGESAEQWARYAALKFQKTSASSVPESGISLSCLLTLANSLKGPSASISTYTLANQYIKPLTASKKCR